jgi:hypothetical protein
MKKLPELLALSIGLGILSLAGTIAWQSVESGARRAPMVETAADHEPMQSGVIASGR